MGTAVPVNRQTLDAFNQAYAARDLAALSRLIDDDATWTINGPVELLQFCGVRRGKAAVLDMVDRLVPELFVITDFIQDSVVLDGDRAATLNRLHARRTDGRAISYRVAQFIRFDEGKVAEYCSIIDSFDAAEQVLGHSISLSKRKSLAASTCVAI